MNEEARVGLYLCECGGEVSKKVDLEKVAEAINSSVEVSTVPMLCTPDTLENLSKEIPEFTRVIFAACTPKRIEKTFEKLAKESGINPYLTQVVNLREQCAWVSEDIDLATDKATHLIKGALGRISSHEPLEEKYIDVNPDVAIIGGGVSGVLAALTLSEDANRTVHIVEKNSYIGGKAITYEDLTPDLTCAPCLLATPLQDVLERPNIKLHTSAEVLEAKGSLGNFSLKVSQKPRYVDVEQCIGCGACIDECPVELPSSYEYGMKDRKAIYFPYPGVLPNVPAIDEENCSHVKDGCQKCIESCAFDAVNFDEEAREFDLSCGTVMLAQGFSAYPNNNENGVFASPKFERLLAKNGPTEGQILMQNGQKPKSIAIVHCAGREELGYCSKICCSIALKYSHMIHQQLPECEIHHVYSDLVLPGPSHSKLYNEVSRFAKFHRMLPKTKVDVKADGKASIEYENERGDQKLDVDMVCLMCGIKPSTEVKRMSEIFDLDMDEFGFLEVGGMLSPVETSAGVLAAGGVLGPCSIEEATQQAIATAGQALSKLRHGEKIFLEPKTCTIDEEKCSGCKICIPLCPYGATSYDEEKDLCVIDNALCKGCGVCASACPTRAIKAQHYTMEQIYSEIEGVTR